MEVMKQSEQNDDDYRNIQITMNKAVKMNDDECDGGDGGGDGISGIYSSG